MSCRSYVQDHIVATINHAGHCAQLPTMPEEAWDSVLDDDSQQRRRLEWVGDSVMRARMSRKVYEMLPEDSVDCYDVLRSCVLSNVTFRHLMQKIGASGVGGAATPFPKGKCPADLFETVVGVFHEEKSDNDQQDEFNEWFDDTFTPLIRAAEAAFRAYKQWESLASGAVPVAPPPLPPSSRRKKKKRKTHAKVMDAAQSYRHRVCIEGKRRVEIARLTGVYPGPPPPTFAPLPQLISLPPPVISRHDLRQMQIDVEELRLEIDCLIDFKDSQCWSDADSSFLANDYLASAKGHVDSLENTVACALEIYGESNCLE